MQKIIAGYAVAIGGVRAAGERWHGHVEYAPADGTPRTKSLTFDDVDFATNEEAAQHAECRFRERAATGYL